MKKSLRAIMFRVWYNYVNSIDKDADILFMNYGFHDKEHEVALDPKFEKNRYSIQLYHRLANAVNLKDKTLVEVGCGRGGGLAYVTERFETKSSIGIDLDQKAVDFGNKHHKVKGLSFVQGNAMSLPFSDQSCDVLLNVESSHRYPDFEQFLSEVKRVLKPNGYFLFTDFRYSHQLADMEQSLKNSGMKMIEGFRINDNVVEALNLDNNRRAQLIKKLIPRFLHKSANNFAGSVGSKTYHQIKDGYYEYYLYVFSLT
jgi:ubiquinone/menaquinone biosynthesis C-methylase UbiE